MATFVLVPGAWHASWCWERVIPLLTAKGHKAIAPDLLATGADPTPPEQVTLAAWADQIADIVVAEPDPVILVGHSRGGLVISETAERVPDNIACLVYVTAFLLLDGQTLLGSRRSGTDAGDSILVPGPQNTTTFPPGHVTPVLYNTTAPEWALRAASLMGPEPMHAFTAPLTVTADRFGRVPRAYIECTEDRAIAIAVQRSFQAQSPCSPVVTLVTDHSPFYSAPDDLAEALCEIAAARPHGFGGG